MHYKHLRIKGGNDCFRAISLSFKERCVYRMHYFQNTGWYIYIKAERLIFKKKKNQMVNV